MEGKWWLTLASSAFGHNVTHFSSRQSELWPCASNAAAEHRTERELCGHGGRKCTECNCGSGQQAGSAMIWQFMVSAFITNVIFHHRRLAPHRARGWDVSSKGLEKKASVHCRIESEWHFVAKSSALQKYKWPGLPGGIFLYPPDLSNTSEKDLVAFVKGRKNSGGDWVNPLSVTSKQIRQTGYDKIRLLTCYSQKCCF